MANTETMASGFVQQVLWQQSSNYITYALTHQHGSATSKGKTRKVVFQGTIYHFHVMRSSCRVHPSSIRNRTWVPLPSAAAENTTSDRAPDPNANRTPFPDSVVSPRPVSCLTPKTKQRATRKFSVDTLLFLGDGLKTNRLGCDSSTCHWRTNTLRPTRPYFG